MDLGKVLTLDDFERAARRHLPRCVFAYVQSVVEEELSSRDNRAAFEELGFVPRTLINVSKTSQETELFGVRHASPFGVAPMGLSSLSAYRGDLVQAAAAKAARIPMILSATSLIRMEEVIAACPGTWFQAYLPGAAQIPALLDRVAAAGFETLVVTVDVAVLSRREEAIRAGFSTPLRPSFALAWDGITHPGWLFGTALRTLVNSGMPHFENSSAARGAPILARNVERDFSARDKLDWKLVGEVRDRWKGRVVLKGVLSAEDARIARERGMDGVIVSNHGGRQLDGAVSPMRVLSAIVEAAGGMTVMMDSGIRRGTDVLKALALGAKFVFVGRPFNYAASVAGEAGVAHAIAILQGEIERGMKLLGVNALAELGRERLMQISR